MVATSQVVRPAQLRRARRESAGVCACERERCDKRASATRRDATCDDVRWYLRLHDLRTVHNVLRDCPLSTKLLS